METIENSLVLIRACWLLYILGARFANRTTTWLGENTRTTMAKSRSF